MVTEEICCVVFQAAQLSMNNVMENEQEYIMQINALSTSLNVGTYTLFPRPTNYMGILFSRIITWAACLF